MNSLEILKSIFNPVAWFLYPPLGVAAAGIVLAIIMVFYLAGMKKLKIYYWVPIAILIVTYIIFICLNSAWYDLDVFGRH